MPKGFKTIPTIDTSRFDPASLIEPLPLGDTFYSIEDGFQLARKEYSDDLVDRIVARYSERYPRKRSEGFTRTVHVCQPGQGLVIPSGEMTTVKRILAVVPIAHRSDLWSILDGMDDDAWMNYVSEAKVETPALVKANEVVNLTSRVMGSDVRLPFELRSDNLYIMDFKVSMGLGVEIDTLPSAKLPPRKGCRTKVVTKRPEDRAVLVIDIQGNVQEMTGVVVDTMKLMNKNKAMRGSMETMMAGMKGLMPEGMGEIFEDLTGIRTKDDEAQEPEMPILEECPLE